MNGWPAPHDMSGYMSTTDRQLAQLTRRTGVPQAAQILGPGLAAHAIQLIDWNDPKTAFNGIFWSDVDSLNSPDPDRPWIGVVESTLNGDGVVTVIEMGPEDPEEWRRTVVADVNGVRTFGAWVRTWPITFPAPPAAPAPFQWDTGLTLQLTLTAPNNDLNTNAWQVTAVVPAGGAKWVEVSVGRGGRSASNAACFLRLHSNVSGIYVEYCEGEYFHNNADATLGFGGSWVTSLPTLALAPGATFEILGIVNAASGGGPFSLSGTGYTLTWFR